MSLAESIRSIVDDQAAAHGFSRVTRLRVEIGRFSCVEKTALAFAFDAAMAGSPAEGAALEMIDLPGTAYCGDCATTVEIADRFDPCPICGGRKMLPDGGDELRVKDMEVI